MNGIVQTLPSRAYIDPEYLKREKDLIFLRHWLFAGHLCELSKAGDFITLSILDQSVVVLRDSDGEIRAYHNVCSHRAHQLLSGRGNCRTIVCPYHNWLYRLDGTLHHAPNAKNVSGFEKDRFSLKPVRVEVLASFVYVNLDWRAPTLASQAPAWATEIAAEFPDVEKLQLINQDSAICRSNWKVVLENFLECYHCRPVHRAFCSIFDLASYRFRFSDLYSTQLATAKASADSCYEVSLNTDPKQLVFWGLFPNTMFSLFPGTSSIGVMVALPDPADPRQSTLRFNTYATKAAEQVFSKGFVELLDSTLREDIACCESVQKGLQSVAYEHGPLLVDEASGPLSEQAVQHFQGLVRSALGKTSIS